MISFPTQFREHFRRVTAAGSPEKVVYESHYDRHGTLILEPTGKINTDDLIQSYKSSTDLSMLVARYNNGDVSALNRVQGIYADLSQAPHSLQEALSIIDRSRSDFDSLPLDIRSKFNNNFAQFVSELGSDVWFDKMNLKSEPVEVAPHEEGEPVE